MHRAIDYPVPAVDFLNTPCVPFYTEEVVSATKQCIREASHSGGHFIGSSSEIVPATPVENTIAFYDACRAWGICPISI